MYSLFLNGSCVIQGIAILEGRVDTNGKIMLLLMSGLSKL